MKSCNVFAIIILTKLECAKKDAQLGRLYRTIFRKPEFFGYTSFFQVIKPIRFFSFFLFLFLPFSSFAAGPPYSKSSKDIFDWADDTMKKLYEDVREVTSVSSEKAEECHRIVGWKTQASLRFELGMKDLLSMDFLTTNSCLREDVYQIDAYINRVSREVSHTALACQDEKRKKYTNFAKNLLTVKAGLQKFGNLSEEEEKKAKNRNDYPLNSGNFIGELPDELDGDFLFFDEVYVNQGICLEPISFASFHRTRQKVENINEKFNQISKAFSAMSNLTSDFVSGKENKQWNTFWNETNESAQKRGKRKAEAWFSRNIKQPVFTLFIQAGHPLIYAGDRTKDRDRQKQEKRNNISVPDKRSFQEVLDVEKELKSIFQMTREDEENFQAAVMFQKFFNKIHTSLSEYDLALSDELEAKIQSLPAKTKATNEDLLKVKTLLRQICSAHESCANRM